MESMLNETEQEQDVTDDGREFVRQRGRDEQVLTIIKWRDGSVFVG